MQTTVKISEEKKVIVFKIRKRFIENKDGELKKGWEKLLYFSCKYGHKGQYKKLDANNNCPKCKKVVAVLERCPQCKSPSMTCSVAGIVHPAYTITTGDQVYEVWPCKECRSLLKRRSKKVLGFTPSILFY